jgi:hypothetical protein
MNTWVLCTSEAVSAVRPNGAESLPEAYRRGGDDREPDDFAILKRI